MSLEIKVHNQQTYVVDKETNFAVGMLLRRYDLLNEFGDVVAVINSAEQAIPLIEAHVKANPPRWERIGSRYQKMSWYGVLTVEPSDCGGWLAYRDHLALLKDGVPAVFDSYPKARAAAEVHLRDGFPSAISTGDTLKWFDGEINISGTLDGELDPLVFPARLPQVEQALVHKFAQEALLERAIGVSVVKALFALATTTKRNNADTQFAANALAVEMPRLVRLFRRSREYGVPFEATAKTQGMILLRETLDTDTPDEVLDSALDLPLQFLMGWVHWDKRKGPRGPALLNVIPEVTSDGNRS